MGDCPAASQRRDAGKQREGGRNMLSGDDQQPSETQNEVYQVGDKEAEEISAHSKTGKQKIEKKHIQSRGENIIPHTDFLLAQAFCHCVSYGVTV